MSENIYAGPGKVYRNALAFFPEGENGQVTYGVKQEKVDRSAANYGRVTSLQANSVDVLSFTPFDNWGSLAALFPAYLGVSVGATTGALAIGTRPHGATGANVATKLWCMDGRLISMARSAFTKHPDVHLGIDKALFGPAEITGILADGKKLGDANAFRTLTASGAADPGGQFTMADFQGGAWTGAWGATAGWGGDGGDAIEAEDEWVISNDIKYNPLPVQKLIRGYTLASVSFMAKCRPYGPTQAQIDTAINAATLGKEFSGGDLVLTGPNAKTITLKNCGIFGAGYEFGGTKLGNGEIGFVNTMVFTGGVPQPLLVFSA